MSLIQALYWFSFIGLLLFSWSRSRGILHPHFMFCAMLFFLASDFMIRGMDDQNLQGILESSLTSYQLATLATMIGIGLSTAIVRRPYELDSRVTQPDMRISTATARYLVIISLTVFAIHTGYRLNAVDWSIQELFDTMLGPRDTRIWDQPGASGARDPVYQLVSGMLLLAASALAFVLFSRQLVASLIAGLLFAAILFVLITDGSRTQAIIPMASLAIFGLMSFRGVLAKTVLLLSVAVLIALVTSAMILFRAQGLEGTTSSFALTYHQDDSIYRVWSACAFADFSNRRWDAAYFFYYIIANPIPRVLWEGKPLLTEDFFSGYKLFYVTTTFMGEWVAMLGVWLGFVASFVFGNVLYRVFYFAQRLLTQPFGLPAYLLVALYIYMVMRSMPNITTFIFAPAAALLLVYFARRRKAAAPRSSALPTGAAGGASAWSN